MFKIKRGKANRKKRQIKRPNLVTLLDGNSQNQLSRILSLPQSDSRRKALLRLATQRFEVAYRKAFQSRVGVPYYVKPGPGYDKAKSKFAEAAEFCLTNGWDFFAYILGVSEIVSEYRGFAVKFPPPRMLCASHFITEYAVRIAPDVADSSAKGFANIKLKCVELPEKLKQQFNRDYTDDQLVHIEEAATAILWYPEFGVRPKNGLRDEVYWAAEHVYGRIGHDRFSQM